ncbi:MAG: tetraacyldisaccharide 4'-kinase [Caulobacteraceae bacterium]|nr:tetraacyldisaccharide 4'-kinase [Caulobacteraceae bacterium]
MKLATPRWWYQRDRRQAPVTRALLTPASWIWAWTTARRIARARPLDPGPPVICVGNLTVGGTGKTPIVRELVRLLADAGRAPQVLTRGHGGRLAGPVQVDPDTHAAADVGDEPLMLARAGPVWVARDRAAGAVAATAHGAGAIVMDDGHQNPTLTKALSLVVVDGETRDGEWPFGDGAVMPAGPMREPLKAGLARADAVIVLLPADLAAPDPELLALLAGKPVLTARLEPLSPPPDGPLMGFAGIGKPWKVERALVAAGADLADFAAFPDHASYDARTLAALADRAAALGARLITTEKDWVRLRAAWRERVTAWPVRARFEDEAAIMALLACLPHRGEGQAA